jgi:hypothetical protein
MNNEKLKVGQVWTPNDDRKYFTKGQGYEITKDLGNGDFYIEDNDESQPHSIDERWINDNFTLMPQKETEMNTKKMIPIDCANNITPIVIGDGYYNSGQKFNKFVDQAILDRINNASGESLSNDHLFITSFADRPNTGKQPVGDDVIIDTGRYTDEAKNINWKYIDNWKPNHAAMLKQYQAEQLAEEAKRMDNITMLNNIDINEITSKVIHKTNSAVKTLEQLNYSYNGAELWKPPIGKKPDYIKTPTFTQAMADDWELPPIGYVGVMLSDSVELNVKIQWSRGDKIEIIANVKGSDFRNGLGTVAYNITKQEVNTFNAVKLLSKTPIQTDEDKAIDDLDVALSANRELLSVFTDVINAIKGGKIHDVKWVGK